VQTAINPPPARFCMQGRWRRREQRRNMIKVHLRLAPAREEVRTASKRHESSSGSLLHAREVKETRTASKRHKPHGSLLHAREARTASKRQHRLAIAREGGGEGEKGVETSPPARSCMRGRWRRREWRRNVTSGSLWRAREVEDTRTVSTCCTDAPPGSILLAREGEGGNGAKTP